MKNQTKIIISICLFTLSVIVACKKDESKEFTDTPIIESYLTPGSYFTVKVSRQTPFASSVEYSSDDINNLSLSVLHNNTTHVLTPLGDGKYVDSSIIVTTGDKYELSFIFNNKNVTATTYTPTTPTNFKQSVSYIYITRIDGSGGFPSGGMTQPDPVELTWDNADASYYLVIAENLEATLDPIRDFGDNEPPGNLFRKSPTTSTAEELRAFDFQYYGRHRIILYHVLPDYASLYDDVNASSQNLANPSTSIINGYGIFTGLNSDTLFINVIEEE